MHLDDWILGGGLIAIAIAVFAESGLLVGFFLPGDTLLLGAGVLASQDILPIEWLLPIVVAAAIIGDNVGYSLGRRTGKRLLKKKDSLIFRHEHIQKAEDFYEKHGGKTIILARFVPIIRTFAPMVAGISKMPRERFMFFNVFGGLLWGAGVTMIGYLFGSAVPWIKNYIEPVLILIVVGSVGIAVFHLLKDVKTRQILKKRVKLLLQTIMLNKKVD